MLRQISTTLMYPPSHGRSHPLHARDSDGAHANRDIVPFTAVIVEDDFFSLMATEDMARDAGLDVVATAINASEARQFIAEFRPDLVIMDINLGTAEDGIDIALDIYDRFGIRCLFTTAYSEEELKSRAGHAEPLGWVLKPFGGETLGNAIRRACDMLEPKNG